MNKFQAAAAIVTDQSKPKRYRYLYEMQYQAAMLVWMMPLIKKLYCFFIKHELYEGYNSDAEEDIYRVVYLKFPFRKRLIEWNAGERADMEAILSEFQDFDYVR